MEKTVKDELRKWTTALINAKGGANEVSKATGLNYQVLRQITLEERHPTWDVFAALHQQWPNDVNLNALASGRFDNAGLPDSGGVGSGSASDEVATQVLIKQATEKADRELEKMKLELKFKDELLETVKDHNQTLKVAVENFPEVTNDTTGDCTDPVITIPHQYFRHTRYSEYEVASMMVDVLIPGRA
ncbi:hypothetical protein GCM10027299_25270 [Larkinella ripae]